MSLLRLPFTFAALWAIHATMTPPNVAPPDHERRSPGSLDLERVAPAFALLAKGLFYAVFVAEALWVLTSNYVWSSEHLISSLPTDLSPTLFLSFLFMAIGVKRRTTCYRIMSSQFTFELAIRKDHKLITHGPYAVVRHPSYTGALMVMAGCVMHVFDEGSWLAYLYGTEDSIWWPRRWVCAAAIAATIASLALVPRMRKEDKMLQEAFGEEWEKWRKQVPYKLVPKIY